MALHIGKRIASYGEGLFLILALSFGGLTALFSMIVLRDRPSDIYSLDKVKERMFGRSWKMLGTSIFVFTLIVLHFVGAWVEGISDRLFSMKEDTSEAPKLVAQASGVVLEIGPGTGSQIARYDKSKVTKAYGVEPNPDFKDALQEKIKAKGMTDEYTVLPCGVDDREVLASCGITPGSIDTILDIQVLCGVPDPDAAAKALYGYLKPGGKWIVYEHIRSHDVVSRFVQSKSNMPVSSQFPRLPSKMGVADFMTDTYMIVWPYIGGNCHLNRPIKAIIENAGEWESNRLRIEDDGWQLIPRVMGILTKKS